MFCKLAIKFLMWRLKLENNDNLELVIHKNGYNYNKINKEDSIHKEHLKVTKADKYNLDEPINVKFKCLKTKKFFVKQFRNWDECHAWHKIYWNDVVLYGKE